ncbi:MAG TPA: DUF6345 domain-containing protein [Polyangiales bacterium]|nr:DUF6345 domain-containing protein [Polyangiales bacterium]
MQYNFRKTLGRCSALALSAAISCPATAALADKYEVKIYGVTKWDGGTCGGSQRDSWDDMALAWYNTISKSSWYYRKASIINGNIASYKFADNNLVTWGQDTSYLDDADAALVFWHGSESSNVYRGSMRLPNPSNSACKVYRNEMQVGDRDLEFLALSSCQSMDDNQWGTWWQAFKGLHQADGFHGLMWIGPGHVGDYEDFADDAFDDNIADAWLDNLYRPNVSNGDDQCPVAYGVGNGRTDLWNRIDHERYDNVFSDPTTYTRWGATFIGGCDPAAETVINSDRSK